MPIAKSGTWPCGQHRLPCPVPCNQIASHRTWTARNASLLTSSTARHPHQYHGYKAVEAEDGTWKLYCLLDNREWDSGRGGSDSIDAWEDEETFRACAGCAASLRKRAPEIPQYSFVNHHLQVVPPVLVDHTRVVEACQDFPHNDTLVAYWRGDQEDLGVLLKPTLAESQMLAAARPVSFVFRLLSSSQVDAKHAAAGKSVFDKPEKKYIVDTDNSSKQRLQRGTKGHTISYRHDVSETMAMIASGAARAQCTTDVADIMPMIKIQLIGPQFNDAQLAAALAEAKILTVRHDVLRDWFDHLRTYSVWSLYGDAPVDAAAEAADAGSDGHSLDASAASGETVGASDADAAKRVALESAGIDPKWSGRCHILSSRDFKKATAAVKQVAKEVDSGYTVGHSSMAPTLTPDGTLARSPFQVYFDHNCAAATGGVADDAELAELWKRYEQLRRAARQDPDGIEARELAKIEDESADEARSAQDAEEPVLNTSSSIIGVNADCVPESVLRRAAAHKLAARSARAEGRGGSGADSDAEDEESDGEGESGEHGARMVNIRGAPMSDWDVGRLLYASHPDLFPNGRGYATDRSRAVEYTDQKWLAYLGGLTNRSYSQDYSFGFDIRDIISRHTALKRADIKLRHKDGAHYSPEMLRSAIDLIAKGRTNAEICKVAPGLSELLHDITVTGGGIMGSPWYRKSFRRLLRALEMKCGIDGFGWLTVNLCDMTDPHIMLMAGERTVKLRVSKAVRHRLIALDPAAAADWFHTFLVAMIEELLGFDMATRKPTHRGVLGTVEELAYVVEAFGRGSLHAHFKLLIKELTLLVRIINSGPLLRLVEVRIQEVIDSIVSRDVMAVPSLKRGDHVIETVFVDGGQLSSTSRRAAGSIGDQLVPASPDCGASVKVTSRRPPREFEGVVDALTFKGTVDPSSGKVLPGKTAEYAAIRSQLEAGAKPYLIRRSLPKDQYVSGGDLDHTPVAKTMMVRDGAAEVSVPIASVRSAIPPPSASDYAEPAFGPSFFGDSLQAHAGVLAETGAAPVLDAGSHRPLLRLSAGALALMHKKDETFVSVVMLASVDDDAGTVTVDYLGHQTQKDAEYDLYVPLDKRHSIVPEWVIVNKHAKEEAPWYNAPTKEGWRGSGKHVRRTETLSQSRVNVLAAGFKLAARNTLPPEVCTAASRLINGWDGTWGTPPNVSQASRGENAAYDDWHREIPTVLGSCSVENQVTAAPGHPSPALPPPASP